MIVFVEPGAAERIVLTIEPLCWPSLSLADKDTEDLLSSWPIGLDNAVGLLIEVAVVGCGLPGEA